MSQPDLGRWAAIDIETTGIDAQYDSVIDIGFLQFEGTQLVKRYSSLVRYEGELSQFIQKLTGIKKSQLQKAPRWIESEHELLELHAHKLLAHNASFEQGFLERYFEVDAEQAKEANGEREEFVDSIPYLAILDPGRASLSLETFIVEMGLRTAELHRGYEDSLDLIKVMLLATYRTHLDPDQRVSLGAIVGKHLANTWYAHFYHLEKSELLTLAEQIEFDLEAAFEKWQNLEKASEAQEPLEIDEAQLPDFSGDSIKNLFGDVEAAQEKLTDYQFREPQQELALKLGQAFKNNVHCIVEAPTGTGKTLGYLIPSALFALRQKEQVLLATGTKALQNQAIQKDVPLLRKFLGLSEQRFKVALLIGSGNHFCELMYRQRESEDLFFENRSLEERLTSAYMEAVFYTNSRRSFKRQITRDKLAYSLKRMLAPLAEIEKSIAVDFRACSGSKCPYSSKCSYMQGLREAKEADLIVGNHSLMLTWPKGVDKPAYAIVDEAHRLENEATSAYTYRVEEEQLQQIHKSLVNSQGVGSLYYLLSKNEDEQHSGDVVQGLREEIHRCAGELEKQIQDLPAIVEKHFMQLPRYTEKYWNEAPLAQAGYVGQTGVMSIRRSLGELKFTFQSLYEILMPYLGRFELKDFQQENDILAWTTFEAFASGIVDLYETLVILLEGKENYTLAMKYHAEYGFAFEAAPVDVGKQIHEQLLKPSASFLFTSATLGNSSKKLGAASVEWSTGYKYLEPPRRFRGPFFLEPVFNYSEKAKVFLCDDVPSLYDPKFVEHVMDPVCKLVQRLEGKSLLLFSSKVRFELAREIVLEQFEGKIPVFVQGMGHQVVEDFKRQEAAILLGMEAFGEGIDLPGEMLQFLFVDKIPDLRQDLVINERRQFYDREFGNEFQDYYLAHRARSLKQKLGRLLRRESDYGGAIVVDSRIARWKARTRSSFNELLGPYTVESMDLEAACQGVWDFLQKQRGLSLEEARVEL